MSPWKDRDGSRLSGCVRSLARSLASAIGWKLILKHRKKFDPRGGPKRGQVEANLRAVEGAAATRSGIVGGDRRGRVSDYRLGADRAVFHGHGRRPSQRNKPPSRLSRQRLPTVR